MPCTHLSPATIVFQSDESIIIGTRDISGSDPTRFKKRFMQAGESSIPSSKFTSIMFAPFSTCPRATDSASEKRPSFIIFRNAAEPITLVRSPTNANGAFFSGSTNGSSPESASACDLSRGFLGANPEHARTIASMCFGVVPQHPPNMFTSPSRAYSESFEAVISGVSSYPDSEKGLGIPAFG